MWYCTVISKWIKAKIKHLRVNSCSIRFKEIFFKSRKKEQEFTWSNVH